MKLKRIQFYGLGIDEIDATTLGGKLKTVRRKRGYGLRVPSRS